MIVSLSQSRVCSSAEKQSLVMEDLEMTVELRRFQERRSEYIRAWREQESASMQNHIYKIIVFAKHHCFDSDVNGRSEMMQSPRMKRLRVTFVAEVPPLHI